jgi:hypothetical protein
MKASVVDLSMILRINGPFGHTGTVSSENMIGPLNYPLHALEHVKNIYLSSHRGKGKVFLFIGLQVFI